MSDIFEEWQHCDFVIIRTDDPETVHIVNLLRQSLYTIIIHPNFLKIYKTQRHHLDQISTDVQFLSVDADTG
jgi:hypothetical protein